MRRGKDEEYSGLAAGVDSLNQEVERRNERVEMEWRGSGEELSGLIGFRFRWIE